MHHAPQAGDLLAWYDRHARVLPWRTPPHASRAGARTDPYRVWLSEIMLQQTTVAAVIPYFQAFTERWPTVGDLAAASDDAVRSAWAGLGYYRRAANLLACARAVAASGGAFPATRDGLKALPGIGDYTSAAIAAIAFGQAVPVVDGNVERVVTRLFALGTPLPQVKRDVVAHLAPLVPAGRPGDFAQAMMDLGATLCTPRKPACALCPWQGACAARRAGTMEDYPVKVQKKARPRRLGAALVVQRADGSVWCERRPPTGLLPGMTQVPTTPWTEHAPAPFVPARHVGEIEHVFTHFALSLAVYHRQSEEPPSVYGWWSPPDRLAQEAWPSVMVKVLRRALPQAGAAIRPKRR